MGREIAKMGLIMKLDDLALFLTVVRCGSFALAAKQKSMSTSTLSRRIQQLEQDTGSILLIRNSKELVLTKEGEQLFHLCTVHKLTLLLASVLDKSPNNWPLCSSEPLVASLKVIHQHFCKQEQPGGCCRSIW